MFGQAASFNNYTEEKMQSAMDRYKNEYGGATGCWKQSGAAENRSDEYIADMAV